MKKYLPTLYTLSCQDCDYSFDESPIAPLREAQRHARKEKHKVLLRKIDQWTYDGVSEVKHAIKELHD